MSGCKYPDKPGHSPLEIFRHIATLSRDTAHANDSISPIFNKEKEQQRLQTAQMIGEIGSQVADIARTQGEIGALKEAQKVKGPAPEGASEKVRNAYIESLKATTEYKKAIADSGTGSSLQRGIQAATAAVQGLAGGDFKAALAGASAPYLAELIHKNTTTTGPDGKEVVNTAANLMAHAVVGAVIAQAQGNSALSGASGAALGEFIAQEMYPGIARTDLNEEQKQTISALGTLAAGLAGGLADGSASGAIAGAQAGKNALENNALNSGYDEEEHEREHGNPPQKLFKLSPRSGPLQDADGRTIPGGAIIGPGAVPIKGSNEGVTTVVVDSGKKGAWNKAMNNPEPNTVYNVDGNKTYQTDELTRTTNVSASLSLSKNDRNGYQQCKAGKCGNPGDEGGHLIASIFNGPGEKLNLVPMDGNLNKGAWKQMENTWANALKDGNKVDVNIQPIYSGNNTRPDRVIVKYSIDGGRPVNIDFKNSPGGK